MDRRGIALYSYYKNLRLKNKIFLCNALVVIVSLTALSLLTNSFFTQANITATSKSSSRELTLIQNNIENVADNIENYSRSAASDYRLQEQLEKIRSNSISPIQRIDLLGTVNEVLPPFVAPNTNVKYAGIMTLNGQFISGDNLNATGVLSVYTPRYLRYVEDSQTPVWTGLIRIKNTEGQTENMFSVAKAIISLNTGKTLGIVILFFSETDFSSIYSENMVSVNDKFYIENSGGTIISTMNKNQLYQKMSSLYPGMQKPVSNTSGSGKKVKLPDHKNYLLSSTKITNLNWTLVSLKSFDVIEQENRRNDATILLIGFICMVFSFIAAYYLSYTVSNPIRRLENVMKEIVHGYLDARVTIETSDEIGELGMGFNVLMDRITALMDEIYHQQAARRESDLKLLQNQVNPHFLYNTIGMISSLIMLDMKENAIEAANSLADFYRHTLNQGEDLISIENEIRITESYLSIMKLRYVDYMDFEIQFDDAILNEKIPKLTLQPLAENSIYHGLKPKGGNGKLLFRGYAQGERIHIEVTDNGVGMSEKLILEIMRSKSDTPDRIGFGLSGVKSRLKLFLGESSDLKVSSEIGQYTKIDISFPRKNSMD